MLVRIQGKVTAIDIKEGISGPNSKNPGRPWQKKVYTISDDFKNPEYNRSVQVNDLGKLDPNSYEPTFLFKSNHIIDEKVDIVCSIETNKFGFTNVDYYKPFEETENKPASTGNVTYAKDADAQVEEPQPAETQEVPTNELPF